MSDSSTHPGATTELDASVDALADQIGAPLADAHVESHAEPDAPSAPPPAASRELPADEVPVSSGETLPIDQASAEALLSDISAEIERTSPGPLPTPPEPPPAAAAPASTLPTAEDIASAAAEVDADLGAFEAPSDAEVGSTRQPSAAHDAPEPELALVDHAEAALPAAPAPSSPASPVPGVSPLARPGPEIKKLDAVLAAGAERALATARAEPPAAEPEVIPELPEETPEPIIVAPETVPAAPSPAPKPAAKSAPTHKPAPIVAAAPVPEPELAPAAKPGLGSKLAALLALPLRPLVMIHETLAEPTRQTIGYCAIITLFFGACVWGKVLFLPAKSQLEPKTEAVELYDENTPAHGITAPPKHGADPAKPEGGHGESAGGHGEAKKPDAHGKSAKKSSASEHGGDAHAKPEKKSSRSKKTASAEGQGGH